jgi:hypothetical protein
MSEKKVVRDSNVFMGRTLEKVHISVRCLVNYQQGLATLRVVFNDEDIEVYFDGP